MRVAWWPAQDVKQWAEDEEDGDEDGEEGKREDGEGKTASPADNEASAAEQPAGSTPVDVAREEGTTPVTPARSARSSASVFLRLLVDVCGSALTVAASTGDERHRS